MFSNGLAMNHNAALASCPVQAKRKDLRFARAHQREAGTRAETNNRLRASRAELKAPLQRTGLDLNNTGLKAKLRQQGFQF